MNVKTILKLFGLDVKKPLDLLLKVLLLVDDSKLTSEVQDVMCLKMSAPRKKEVSTLLRQAADALDNSDCPVFANTFVKIIKGIKI